MEFPLSHLRNWVDPAFESLLALFAAPAGERLKPIRHPTGFGVDPDSLREAAVLIPVTRPGRSASSSNNPEICVASEHSTSGTVGLAPEESSAVELASKVVLTVRAANLKSHAGQISLPGGSIDPEDANPAAAALREAEEEIGLPQEQVEIMGELGPMDLPSGFRVMPVVGLIPPGLAFTPCSREVADIFQTPLALILDPKAYIRSSYLHAGIKRPTLELHYEDYRIWGATAAILHRLAALCAGTNSPTMTG